MNLLYLTNLSLTALLRLDWGFLSTGYPWISLSERIPELHAQRQICLQSPINTLITECWLAQEPAEVGFAPNPLLGSWQAVLICQLPLVDKEGAVPCLSKIPFMPDIFWFWKWSLGPRNIPVKDGFWPRVSYVTDLYSLNWLEKESLIAQILQKPYFCWEWGSNWVT